MNCQSWPTAVALAFGLLSIPISYYYTLLCESLTPMAMLGTAAGIMTAVLVTNFLLTKGHVKNKMYYGFAMFVFSGVIDIFSGLEMDGFVQGFLTLYLKHGEPYLASAWGAVVSYWDGTVFLVCYLTMAYLSSNGRSYRTIGLHWSSGILNSMIVLLLGACLSKSGLGWCTLLNIPYVLFPLAVAVQCLTEPSSCQPQKNGKPSWLDKILFIIMIEASLAALLKGLAAIGSTQSIPLWYRTMAEPVLQEEDPAPFAALQGLVALFYFFPGYLTIAWGIIVNPGQTWLQDLSVIIAGASLHASGSTVGIAFHNLTKPVNRIPSPENHSAHLAFWAVNMLIGLVPQIVALRLMYLPVDATQAGQQEKKLNKQAGQQEKKLNKQTTDSGKDRRKKSSKKLKEH